MATTNFSPIDSFSFLQFCMLHGDPNVQETSNGECLVFNDPLTGKDTYVAISSRLEEPVTKEFLNANYATLQVCQTEPDEETLARRRELQKQYDEEAKANGTKPRKVQMESYVLCRQGQSKRKSLGFNWRALAAMSK